MSNSNFIEQFQTVYYPKTFFILLNNTKPPQLIELVRRLIYSSIKLPLNYSTYFLIDSWWYFNQHYTYGTYTTIGISIAGKNSSLNFPFSELSWANTLSYCPISQYISLLFLDHRNPELWFLSIFSFLESDERS